MITLTLARKPPIGSIARNALQFGTGAINIDASRIKLDEGEKVHIPQSDPTKRVGEVGRDLGITRSTAEKMQQAQRESIERTNTLGRFPANVILNHGDGCGAAGCNLGCPIPNLDEQSGESKSSGGVGDASRGGFGKRVFGQFSLTRHGDNAGGLGDAGGASRYFKQFGGKR